MEPPPAPREQLLSILSLNDLHELTPDRDTDATDIPSLSFISFWSGCA